MLKDSRIERLRRRSFASTEAETAQPIRTISRPFSDGSTTLSAPELSDLTCCLVCARSQIQASGRRSDFCLGVVGSLVYLLLVCCAGAASYFSIVCLFVYFSPFLKSSIVSSGTFAVAVAEALGRETKAGLVPS